MLARKYAVGIPSGFVSISLIVLPLCAALGQLSAGGQRHSIAAPRTGAVTLQLPGEQAAPVSMVSGDFDGDGFKDLAIGYRQGSGGMIALLRGNPEALAPTTRAGWEAAGRHEIAQPFLQSQTIPLASAPSLMATADINGDGRPDLVYATAGSSTIDILLGTANGGLQAKPYGYRMPGTVTALAAYRPGAPMAGEALLVAYQTAAGAKLSILSDKLSMVVNATYALPAAATMMTVANLDADLIPDTAIVAGGKLLVLHGLKAIGGAGQLQTLPIAGVASVAAGEFLFDRHAQMQLSVATSSGEAMILAHQGFDPRPYTPAEITAARQAQQRNPGSPTLAELAGNTGGAPWIVVESEPEIASRGVGSEPPVLLRSRWSGSGQDDLLLLDGSNHTQTVIRHLGGTQALEARAHPEMAGGLAGQKRVGVNQIGSGKLVGAVSMRLSADGRSGVVMLFSDRATPEFAVPSAGNTFYVNTTADNTGSIDADDGARCSSGSGESCTLRDAIAFANADATDNINGGTSDTIMLPAGTYPLSWQSGTFDGNGNAVTHLEVLGPVSIVGAGAASTIINGEANDTVFTINPGEFGSENSSGDSYVFDMAMENLTIEGGKNQNNPATSTTGLSNNVGGGINWDADGTGNLTLTNVAVSSNKILYGAGGGIWIENSAGGGTGTLTLTGGSVNGNKTPENGGGLYVATPPAAVSATGTAFQSNVASASVNSGDPGVYGDAGGLYFASRTMSPATPQSVLNQVSIVSNSADEEGGGIETYSGILLENSIVSGNQSQTLGGGFYTEIGDPEVASTITSTNVVNNFGAADGGGIYVGADNPSGGTSLDVSLSRFFGNISSETSGLATASPGAATATENWWGCNGGPSTAGCDRADSGATVNPWAVFTLSANPTTFLLGSSTAVFVNLNTDSNSNPITGAFPAVSCQSCSFTLSLSGISDPSLPVSGPLSGSGTGSATVSPTSSGNGTLKASFDNQIDQLALDVTAPASTSLTFSPAPISFGYGNAPVISVQLNPSNATGITTGDFAVTVDGSSTYDGSGFSLSSLGGNLFEIVGPFDSIAPASHQLEVQFAGAPGYAGTHSTASLNVSLGTVNVGDAFTPASPIQGQAGSVAVTVAGVGSGAAPSGSVSYKIDSGSSSNVSLVGGSATIPLPATLKTGSHTLSLNYLGDANYGGSTVPASFTVLGKSLTTIEQLTTSASRIQVFGYGFTAPSGQLSLTDTTGGTPVTGPATLNTAAAATALLPQATTSTGAGSLPDWTTVGDVNGDGIADLVTSVFGTNSVNVQLGNGDGTFGAATPILIAAGFGPAESHLASLRGNGTLDIVVGSFNTNQIAVLLGNGNGTFQTPVFYTVGSAAGTPTSLTTGDFNDDGALDVAAAVKGDNAVTILLGNGSGALEVSGAPVGVGPDPEAVRAGDFNGDGYSDLAVANYANGTVTTLLNQQNGTFTAATLATGSGAGSGPQALAISGSGAALLLAVANYHDNTISVMASNGAGGFGGQTILPAGTGPDDVAFADFNGDGVPDLAVANYTSGTVSLILGTGGGSYAAHTDFAVGKNPYSVALGDLDLDGTPDIVVPNCFSNNTGVLLSGTAISAAYGTLPFSAGHNIVGSYVPDGASAYGASTSPGVTAP